jgi:predicted nucleic-acid-binding protein
MIGVDTNVLLRLFTADSPEQSRAAIRPIDGHGPSSIRLTNIVIVELVWTLVRYYKLDRSDIISVIEQLLERVELSFESRGPLMTALHWFERGRADFADYLIAALNEESGATPTYTFDQVAAVHQSFALIMP